MSVHTAFHRLSIAEIRRETPSAISIVFAVPDDLLPHFRFEAGQHLTLRTTLNGRDVRRNYSLCVSPLDNELRIAIKQRVGGFFSVWANHALKAGDIIEVMPPMGNFTLPIDPAVARSYVGFAGGSGITPVLSLLKTVLLQEPKSTFTLLYGNQSTASTMFLEELAGLKDRFMDRFQLYHFMDDEEEEIALFNGRLDEEKCEEVLRTLIDAEAVDQFFICGPKGMMTAAEAALLKRGIPKARILIERFGVPLVSPEDARRVAESADSAQGRQIGVVIDGRRVNISFDAAKGNILENIIAAGIPAPYACKGGVCATCRGKVLKGEVTMAVNYGLSDQEVSDGYVLTCQSIPDSDDVVISYDA